jgi:probable rRNA maturation factor
VVNRPSPNETGDEPELIEASNTSMIDMPEGDQSAVARTAKPRGLAAAPTRLRVRISDEQGRPVPARGLASWLARVAPGRARGVVSVALVSDRCIRTLNRSYRRRDCATDVLSFPAFARTQDSRASARHAGTARTAPGDQPPAPSPLLGDIVIARTVARRQAKEAGHSELSELKVLALHGLLHLLGYDHDHDNGRMLRLERRLRRKGGLREGLIERARR